MSFDILIWLAISMSFLGVNTVRENSWPIWHWQVRINDHFTQNHLAGNACIRKGEMSSNLQKCPEEFWHDLIWRIDTIEKEPDGICKRWHWWSDLKTTVRCLTSMLIRSMPIYWNLRCGLYISRNPSPIHSLYRKLINSSRFPFKISIESRIIFLYTLIIIKYSWSNKFTESSIKFSLSTYNANATLKFACDVTDTTELENLNRFIKHAVCWITWFRCLTVQQHWLSDPGGRAVASYQRL